MKFACYTAWEQLPAGADELFKQAERASVFYSRPWFEHLVASLPAEQSILFAGVVEADRVLALLPLIQTGDQNFQSFKHPYGTHYSLLVADTDSAEQVEAIIHCLAQGLLELSASSLLLEPLISDDTHVQRLQSALENNAYQCERYFRAYNWIYRVEGRTFQEYLQDRPARLRNTITRKQRKLERDQGYELRMYIDTDVPAAMPDYYAPYTASWKANEQYVGFVDDMVEAFSKQGWMRLGVLYVDGLPVAAQLWFVVHGKASIFRLAYDEAWKSYSPGSILTAFMMEHVIDTDRVDEIDFLSGNDAYKQDWMSERREHIALSCTRPVKPAGMLQRAIAALQRLRF